MLRLAIITTHPIQYYAPVFELLAAQNPDTLVFYTWGEDAVNKFDPGFQKKIEWDIPLLQGYQYRFLKNTAISPGTETFRGIINPEAISCINKFNPDTILVYGWSWHSHLNIIRHYHGKKKIWFRGDSTLLDPSPIYKKWLRRLFLSWVYSHVDGAFYVGLQNKSYFKHVGLKESQLQFAPHAVDNHRFAVSHVREAAALRENLNIPPNGLLILFAGKLEPKKDPLTLLAAFEKINTGNLFLLFAGNGVLETELKSRAALSPKRAFLRFISFQNQGAMPVLYQASQIFCLPSAGPGETWGLAVNEAMAAGLPVIVSDKVGCGADLVEEGSNGYRFKTGDAEDLSEKIKALIESPARLSEFGKASQKIIFDWSFQTQVTNMLETLNNLHD